MSRNLAASVRARLKQHSDATKQDFNLTLTHFGLERLLYRLSISEYASNFLLKGALLFTLWYDLPHRPTVMSIFWALVPMTSTRPSPSSAQFARFLWTTASCLIPLWSRVRSSEKRLDTVEFASTFRPNLMVRESRCKWTFGSGMRSRWSRKQSLTRCCWMIFPRHSCALIQGTRSLPKSFMPYHCCPVNVIAKRRRANTGAALRSR